MIKYSLRIARNIIIVLIIIIYILPLLYMLFLSFIQQSVFINHEVKLTEIFENLSILNYQMTFKKIDLLNRFTESIRQTLFSVLIIIVFSVPISYYISSLNQSKMKQYSISFLSLKLIPGIAICLPLYYFFNNIIICPNWISLVILNIGFNIPFFIWLAVPIFYKIPQELEDLSYINGLTSFRYIFFIVSPILFKKLLGLSLIISILVWNESFFSSLFRVDTLSESIVSLIGHRGIQWGQILVLGSIITFPVLAIIFILSVKNWIKSL